MFSGDFLIEPYPHREFNGFVWEGLPPPHGLAAGRLDLLGISITVQYWSRSNHYPPNTETQLCVP